MSNRRDRRAPHATTVGVVVLLLALLFIAVDVAAADVSGSAWLSAPASLWSAITGGSNTGTVATQLMSATRSDFTTAIHALDSGAGVTVNSMVPYTAPATGPAYGTAMAYTITSTVLTASQIDDCLRGATLTNLNAAFGAVASSLSLTITVLNANEPADMTKIMDSYLPVTGISYMWELVLSFLNAAGDLATAGFVIPVEQDLQSVLDSTEKLYLAVVPTDTTKSIVNASSLYIAYSVWAYPTNAAPATAESLQVTALTTPLTHFNSFVSGLESAFTDLADYSDFLPSSVKTWTPLVLNPNGSDSSGDVVVVQGNVTGNYILAFNGDADTWGRIWTTQRVAVAASIVAAAEAILVRRNFVTTVEVVSASTVANKKEYVGGLHVVVNVANGYSAASNHTWGPEDLVSMLFQADYTATQAFYVAAAPVSGVKADLARSSVMMLATTTKTAGALTTTGIEYDFSAKLLPFEVGMIIMAAVIGFLVLVAFCIACGCCCCCRHCVSTNKEMEPEWEANLDRYQRGMMNQDAAFAQAENPREAKKKTHNRHRDIGVASGAPEDERCVTPNPLSTPERQREGDVKERALSPQKQQKQEKQHKQQQLTGDDLAKKPPPPPTMTAQGVPLEAPSYAQYLTAAPAATAATTTTVAATAPPPDENELSGSQTKPRKFRRAVSFSDEKKEEQPAARETSAGSPPPTAPTRSFASPLPVPDAENGTGYAPQYMRNMTPTPFFPLPVPEANNSGQEVDALNQTRLSQGSDTRSAGTAPTPQPMPPSYPHYESPRRQHAPMPPAYPLQEATGYAYPSSNLYSGAPPPAVTSSLDSFSPMPAAPRTH